MAKAAGITLREFADTVSDVEPTTITAIRNEMFPGVGGVKNLTGVQLLALRDRLLEAPLSGEIIEVDADTAPVPETAPEAIPAPVAENEGHAVKRCRAVAPISGEQCSLGTGHRGIHRATDAGRLRRLAAQGRRSDRLTSPADHCPECGHHRDWGCAFECPIHRAPSRVENYRAWTEEQKLGYMGRAIGGKPPPERREDRGRE